MSGRAQYTYISATSNQVVRTRPGKLLGVVGGFAGGGQVYINDAHTFGQGVLNHNAVSSNTVGKFTAPVTGLDIGLNVGLAVSVTSNATITIVHEDL